MNPRSYGKQLPESIAIKLRAIRRRALLLIIGEGLARAAAVLAAGLFVAMTLDWVLGWLSVWVRSAITAAVLGASVLAGYAWCVRPLARGRSLVSTARAVDSTLPQLEERWSTVTELSENKDAPEVRGSEALIREVASEAAAAEGQIQPERVISDAGLRHAGRWLAGALALVAILFLANISQARVLFQRFWMPGADVSLTRVRGTPAGGWVPKGEPLLLQAVVEGRIPSKPPTVLLRPESGEVKVAQMAAQVQSTEPGRYQFSIPEVTGSFDYRIRCGDGQTSWQRIRAVDRPVITAVQLRVTPPAYANLPKEQKEGLPQSIRVLEGSVVDINFKVDQPLDRMIFDLGAGLPSLPLSPLAEQWYGFQTKASSNFAFIAKAINQYQLESKNKPGSRLSVYEDLPPSVRVLEPSDDFAVLPGEKVRVTFEASDDLGLAKAEVVVTALKADGSTNTIAIPVPLEEDKGQRQTRQSIELDPKELGLKHGDALSYTVQVTDTKENPAETKPGGASSSPPHEMPMRALDAGQSAACQPRSILVDEWAGRFEGEKRRKLEIAIDPVLRQIDEWLKRAQVEVDSLKPQAPPGLQARHQASIDSGKKALADCNSAIADLKSRTSGTPYSFIGLQLHDIGGSHVTPAERSLSLIHIGASAAGDHVTHLESASFHIARAREKIAALTQKYETVKRDQQIAEATQKLNKMYQVFLEDTQELLGSGPGPINSYDRKIAEVDEAFVEKMKELLEEKKKIMAELAKLLAEDPRMLRRYLAMMQLQGTSYRDQMTLLAERQKVLKDQIGAWNVAAETERGALVERLRAQYATGQETVARDAVQLRENLETWLPLTVKLDAPQVQALLAQAERVVRLTAAVPPSGTGGSHPREQTVEDLRAFRESLPKLSVLSPTNDAKMASFIANRMLEVESLITAQSGQLKIMESLAAGDFPKVAEIVQHRITQETVDLGQKLDATEKQVASLSSEIAAKADALTRVVENEIVQPQLSSVDRLTERAIQPAQELLEGVVPAFARGEQIFDELMQLIIAKLDEAPAPGAPGAAPELESILAMLEDEMKAAEGLGIPCRPINVSVVRDWMRPSANPGQTPGQGMGRAQAQAASGQARQAQAEARRLEEQARENARKSLAQAGSQGSDGETSTADGGGGGARSPGDDWNKLASKLRKDLMQGRDNVAPEQYRAAIENYFRVISGASSGSNR